MTRSSTFDDHACDDCHKNGVAKSGVTRFQWFRVADNELQCPTCGSVRKDVFADYSQWDLYGICGVSWPSTDSLEDLIIEINKYAAPKSNVIKTHSTTHGAGDLKYAYAGRVRQRSLNEALALFESWENKVALAYDKAFE